MTAKIEHISRNPMELLAPAGGTEQLAAAIRFGADAVYLATDRFGMRARASNFALDELPGVVAQAHAAGVSVHVACNVMMGADDIAQLPAYMEAVAAAGADALIVGDLGAMRLARRHAPDMTLHVSTQASIMNAEAARAYRDLGARRIVCAREMSLSDIARLREGVPDDLEIEAFVHGAMCMAMSGRCLISSYLTGRSGNKGHCTQPCRWSYTLEEEKRPGEHFPIEEDGRGTFILNAKDLNMLHHVRELADVGVDAIKIEGRNKKAFYVATVVNAYRRVLDGEDATLVAPELDTVSHRPYGTGFYFGEAEQALDFDGYEQDCLHVADVVACEPFVCGASLGSADGAHAEGVGGVNTDGADGTDAEGAGGAKSDGADGAHADGADGADGVDDTHEASDAGGVKRAKESAASGEAEGCEADEASWVIEALCRNRFAEGDELEALRPRLPVVRVTVRGLTWLPDPTEDASTPPPQPVAVANRSCGRYRFRVEAPVKPGSYLRIRQHRRSARH